MLKNNLYFIRYDYTQCLFYLRFHQISNNKVIVYKLKENHKHDKNHR